MGDAEWMVAGGSDIEEPGSGVVATMGVGSLSAFSLEPEELGAHEDSTAYP